ncbi:MAG: protein kinase [Gemmatimonadaceae bacterium]|nr:protein kinase [Gemmatimonadaceae bacterium]
MPPTSTDHPDELQQGQVFGSYRILRTLGRGGMGVVYEAESLADGRLVALKLLAATLDHKEARLRFLREGRVAATLIHPNTVYIYGTEEIEGTPTIAMEIVAGGTLDEMVSQRGRLPIDEAVSDTLQIIDGLAAAHAAGVLHRDVKPANCYVRSGGEIKVGDFGLSKSIAGGEDMRVTRTGMILGTPAFAAPEQLLGEPLDVRSDIYWLGATLYNLLTGERPFPGANPMNVLAAVLQGSPRPPHVHRPEIPKHLSDIIMQCLSRQAAARYGDYDALRRDLLDVLGGSGTPAPLAPRVLAFLIDFVLATLPSITLMAVMTRGRSLGSTQLADHALNGGLAFAMILLTKAVPESVWGASVGKALVGLRVVRLDGRPLELMRSFGRTTTLWAAISGSTFYSLATGRALLPPASVMVDMALGLALMVTMRRSNGFAAVHDYLLGTRVVRQAREAERQRYTKAAGAESVAGEQGGQEEQGEHVGPFLVRQALHDRPDGSNLHLALDPVLRRSVWIHLAPSGVVARPLQRRSLARSGRLRWVGGRRTPSESWDAYGAPDGRLLLDQPSAVSWEKCVGWLKDLAGELAAAHREGERLTLDVGDVWISSGQQALILDFAQVAESPVEPTPPAGAFLAAVARRALLGQSDGSTEAWPLLSPRVRDFLKQLPSMADPVEVMARLATLDGIRSAVTRRQRAIAMRLTCLPTLIATGAAAAAVTFNQTSAPGMAHLAPLITYLHPSDSTPRSSGSTRVADHSVVAPDSVVAANRRTIGLYLSAVHRGLLSDTSRRRSLVGDSLLWGVVDSVIATFPLVAAADSARAVKTVEGVWEGRPPGGTSDVLEFAGTIMAGSVIGLSATWLLSIFAAAMFRLGWAARTAGLEIVTRSGASAGRFHLTIRSMLTWLPIMPIVPIMWYISRPEIRLVELMRLTSVLLALGGVTLVYALWNPRRSLADHVTGTSVVPR